jgi:hypothetical protein
MIDKQFSKKGGTSLDNPKCNNEPIAYYPLTTHNNDLEIIKRDDGWYSIVLQIDGHYRDIDDAKSVMWVWQKSLNHAREVLPIDLELRRMQNHVEKSQR